MMCLRKATSCNQNSHLLNLAYSSWALNLSSTILRCCSCSSALLEYIRMSSIKTTTNLSNSSINTLFIKFMK
uniref:Uncharacterized protein n=1 Tax=Arundo donax TaxID=35708 RepID=A0A0A9BBR0_ARUDO